MDELDKELDDTNEDAIDPNKADGLEEDEADVGFDIVADEDKTNW
jgi:hypothetical protein